MMKISVINGPNLDLLGTRQPEVYGSGTLADLEAKVRDWASSLGIEVRCYQSNNESDLIDAIHTAARADGVVINPGGFSHTSVAVADAVASIPAPVVEVHISDISQREEFRRVSLVALAAVRQISGRGIAGYRDAMRHLVNRSRTSFETVQYGPHSRNVGEHRSHGDGRDLVVLVHGGFWFPQWDRDQLDSAAIDLFERGHDTFNITYRVTPPWPGSGHDVLSALRWSEVRYNRIGLLGHSAGGYLSLWAGTRHPVDLTVGLAALTDLSLVSEVSSAQKIVAAGGPEKLHPMSNTVLFHGQLDAEVSIEHTRVGATTPVHVLPGIGHFDLINPNRPHWATIASQFDTPS